MNSLHEHPVDNRLGFSPPPHSSRGNERTESPPPVGVQAVTFSAALAVFRAAHANSGVHEPRRSQIEVAFSAALRTEGRGGGESEVVSEALHMAKLARDSRTARCTETGMRSIDLGARFMLWARDNESMLSAKLVQQAWKVSRATAYRRVRGVLQILREERRGGHT